MEDSALTFLTLGSLLLFGLLADEGSRRFGLPRVTLLMLLGFAVGPEALDLLPPITEVWFPTVATVALTLVGFVLGAEFSPERLRSSAKSDLILALVQGLVTALIVTLGLVALGFDAVTGLALGGIAVATDPAATVAAAREQSASGPFTRALMAIVALDDVIALTLFGLLLTLGSYLAVSGGADVLRDSLWEILGAVALGVSLGVPSALLTGRLRPGRPTREEAYGVVLVCAGLALLLHVSFLLAAVVLGATIANRASHHDVPFKEIERIEWPALTVFFLLAGASLDISSFASAGWLGAAYMLLRTAGKIAGCATGGPLAGLDRGKSAWLGAAMLPQAGVAIGLALLAAETFPDRADALLAVTISATVAFELVGPILTRIALVRCGDARTSETG